MRYIILMVCLAFVMADEPAAQTTNDIQLSTTILPDTDQYHGSKVLQFAKPAEGTISVPPNWTDVETAVVGDNPRLIAAIVVRFKDERGEVGYAIANDGKTAVDSTSVLSFHRGGNRMIADFSIAVRSDRDAADAERQISYQIVLSKDRVIARLAECREGTLRVNDRDYGIRLYAPSINNPFFDLSTDAACVIDMNRDGRYSWKWRVDDSDRTVIPSEQVKLTGPFKVDGQTFKAKAVDPVGTLLTCSDYPGDTATVVGFFAPDFSVTDLTGVTHTLGDMKGRIVLLTFWSGRCPYCEKIRLRLDTLVSRCDTTQFQAVSASTDTSRTAIAEFVQERPYAGIVVPYSVPLWKTFNARGTTPVYYVFDRDGSVMFSGSGASAFSVVEQIITNKLSTDQ
ncbi:MAG TPA: TlpA disulfide reductase family protein [candidate division Zixibacteria bacterium]|nr:TlpA disulfide reductase family protein [candidate division Zixibacteria bacterium]